jgi:hypothetical protein
MHLGARVVICKRASNSALNTKKGAMMIARAAFIHQMEDRAACGRISNGFDLISNYTGASCYLVARYDHYSDRHHDFVLTSNWPFDLVRTFGRGTC